MKKVLRNRLLSNAPGDKVFWVSDGRILKNLSEMINALNTMSDETYKFHTSGEKNDFADWVLQVFGSRKIYLKIRTMRKREKVAQAVKKVLDVEKEKKKKKMLK